MWGDIAFQLKFDCKCVFKQSKYIVLNTYSKCLLVKQHFTIAITILHFFGLLKQSTANKTHDTINEDIWEMFYIIYQVVTPQPLFSLTLHSRASNI